MHQVQNQRLSIKGRYWISSSLLMTVLVGQGLKQALSQCILKKMKSNRVIPPLLFGLSDRYGPRYWKLLTEILKLGYAISYDEVNINSEDGWRLQTRSRQKWVYAVYSRQRGS